MTRSKRVVLKESRVDLEVCVKQRKKLTLKRGQTVTHEEKARALSTLIYLGF